VAEEVREMSRHDPQPIDVQQAQYLLRKALKHQLEWNPELADRNYPVSINRITAEFLVYATTQWLNERGHEEWPIERTKQT
jgi:hypothetical protein